MVGIRSRLHTNSTTTASIDSVRSKVALASSRAGSDNAVSFEPPSTMRTQGRSVPDVTETRITSPGSAGTPKADAAGETRHETYGPGEFKVHDLENTGDADMLFMTVEFLASQNSPLQIPDAVRLTAA